MARSTVGAAFVAVLDAPFTDWLAQRLGKGLGVSDGLIRIYMPGLARGDEPLRHPLHVSSREDAGPYLASAIRSRIASDIRRGPLAVITGNDTAELDRLRRENARLERQLAKAQLIIGIQKKAAQLLAIDLGAIDDES